MLHLAEREMPADGIGKLQAALQTISSAEKLELVDQLTDYVSDALAEVRLLHRTCKHRLNVRNFVDLVLTELTAKRTQGKLADDELQYIFQVSHAAHRTPVDSLPYKSARVSSDAVPARSRGPCMLAVVHSAR